MTAGHREGDLGNERLPDSKSRSAAPRAAAGPGTARTLSTPPLNMGGMARRNCYDCFDPFAVALIRKKAHQLVGRSGFVREDVHDLEQELALDLLQRRKKYDPSRASLNTFTSRVVDHKIASMLEAQRAARRDFRKVARELASSSEAEPAEIINIADALATAANDDHEKALRVDVQSVLERLDPTQRELCEGLASSTITELACKRGTTRAVLYEAKAKLVDHFERAGLRIYFEKADRSDSAPVGISMPLARSRR